MVGAKAEAAATHAEKSAVRYIVFVLDFMSSDLYVTRDLMGCSVLVTVHCFPPLSAMVTAALRTASG